jgi:ABC-type lipoprotein release transport system permease subunit
MFMNSKLAWRNIWRNKRRTQLVLAAIIVGLWGMVFMVAIMDWMNVEMVETSIENGVGHIQIHREGFMDNMSVSLNIRNPRYVFNRIEDLPYIAYTAQRIKVRGLISTAISSSGVVIWGIDHEAEPAVSSVATYLKSGEFLSGARGEIYIGRSLADKLKVDLDDKVVITAQGLASEIGTAAYRVKGIFESSSSEYDKYNAYINLADAQILLAMEGRISEIVIIADDMENIDSLIVQLKEKLAVSGLEVLSWKEVIPLIVQMIELFESFNWIVFLIVIIAMAFGIINTILMSVLERTREIGILMAIGTRPWRIFSMVVWEGFYLGLVGLCLGWVFTLATYIILSRTGIDISIWSESMKYIGGIESTIYPILKLDNVVGSSISVFIATMVSTLYPAIKIMRLSPVKAFRSV